MGKMFAQAFILSPTVHFSYQGILKTYDLFLNLGTAHFVCVSLTAYHKLTKNTVLEECQEISSHQSRVSLN
jgi:hypothetical protein